MKKEYIGFQHGAMLCEVDVWTFARLAKSCNAVVKVNGQKVVDLFCLEKIKLAKIKGKGK